ncbi:hypothetical protein JWG42_14425 [Desulfoprunum benzoelyticum]|uniref:Haem-binding uptake Tiki superfamily ChaN domain-containing protein n=1 Tax=Desulfoprunum benzoelyticum TaxID=1506996 RepID=A0A840UTP3_9BACT|nr:hypothetical protein [Desulfoprunum benzoelyticum]MBB5349557.1 hypothetical protein [Desulfoprunum benzoelyticum]MBM9531353.1 hypothetical protein [Desulfoprunum benzoelyticum]
MKYFIFATIGFAVLCGGGAALSADSAAVAQAAKKILLPCQGKGVLVLGERHQHPESQELFLAMIENQIGQGRRVFVGLEISGDQQGNLDALLADPVSVKDDVQLYHAIDHPAYREMLRRLGRYAHAGVDVRAIDAAEEDKDRDVTMSRNVVAAVRSGKYDVVLVLVGNNHAIKKMKWHSDSGSSTRYLAERLVDDGLNVCSVMQRFTGQEGGPVVVSGRSLEKDALIMDLIRSIYHAEDMTGDGVADVVVGW